MRALSNILTLSRGPLAICFLFENTSVRLFVILLAMVTDGLDGFFARRSKKESFIGVFLDPIMDKFFVVFVMAILASEGKIVYWQTIAFFSRDFYLFMFAIYLTFFGDWRHYHCLSVVFSKVSTLLQFLVLTLISLGVIIPGYIYYSFVAIGFIALLEQLWWYYSYDGSLQKL
jgi:phosphatidylglycerophosphate synthase